MIFPLPGHQLAIGVIQVEEPLQVRQRHRAAIAPEGRRFLTLPNPPEDGGQSGVAVSRGGPADAGCWSAV